MSTKAVTHRIATEVFQEALCDLDLRQSLCVTFGAEPLHQMSKEVCDLGQKTAIDVVSIAMRKYAPYQS